MDETSQPLFEIPDTTKVRAFVTRNPQFPDVLLKLNDTANKCFGRDPRPKNHLENLCFWLGHTCRQDFLEVVFLAINGYGAGATKILRSLYERAVTIEYLIDPTRTAEFLKEVHELCEIRQRDGAFYWEVFQDAANPARFVECFMSESWVEHLRQQFPGNKIPLTRFDPVTAKLLPLIPTATSADGLITFARPALEHENQFMGRVDYNLGNQRLYGRYFYARYPRDAVSGAQDLVKSAGGFNFWNQSASIGHSYNFTPHLLNSFIASWNAVRAGIWRVTAIDTPVVR